VCAEVHLERIFGLYDQVNAPRASKIISAHTATSSFEDFSKRRLANIQRQFQELNQLEAKLTELQSFPNLICTGLRHEILLLVMFDRSGA